MLLIIGGTGGLGAGLVQHYSSLSPDRAPQHLEVTNRGTLDLADDQSIARFCEGLSRRLRADEPFSVINAAGVSINAMNHKASTDDFDATLRVNTVGPAVLLRELYPIFKSQPSSSVVLLSSVVATIGVAGTTAYAASKAALSGLARSASRELARVNARVNVIELGYFDVGMIEQLPAEAQEATIAQIPLGRLGTVLDLAAACDFALGCSFVTGATIRVNGGMA